MGIFKFDEGGGFSSTFDTDRGIETSFTQVVVVPHGTVIDNPTTQIPDVQGVSIGESFGLSPEVAAGLNQETLARLASNRETTEAFLNIRETRLNEQQLAEANGFSLGISPDIVAGLNPDALARVAADDQAAAAFVDLQSTRGITAENRILFGKIIGPDVIAGLNPATLNLVAGNQETADRFIELAESRETNAKPGFLDRIVDPITRNVAEGQATVKRAVRIFLILIVVVVVVVLGSLYL